MVFENINIPNNEDGTSIECGSDLMTDIKQYFEQTGRYLNQEDTEGILSRLGDDIDTCHRSTRESFAELNSEMFENGINLTSGGIGEERFLPQIGVNKSDLLNSVQDFPTDYTFRVSGDWVIFSDMQGNPIINYNKTDNTFSEPGMFTMNDSMEDNVDGGDYVLAETISQRGEADEANDALDEILKEGSIQIDELENPRMQENISRLYDLKLENFQRALHYFLDKSDLSLFHQNPDMRLLSNGNFQISVELNNGDLHVVNFYPNGEVESEHVF